MGCECGNQPGDAPGVDGSLGEPGGGREIFGKASGDEDGGGVEDDDVAGWAGDAGKDVAENGGVGLGVAAGEGGERGGGQAEVGRMEGAEGGSAGEDCSGAGRAGEADFVDAGGAARIRAVDDERVAGAEEGEGFGDDGNEVGGVDADHLRGCCGGVGKRAEEVEDGADAEGTAERHDGAHEGMVRGRMEEGEAVVAEGFGGLGGGEVDGDAERLEHVGGAGLRGDGAIAMFGDRRSSRRGDEGCGGGDVEGAGVVAAGAAGVDKAGAFGVGEGERGSVGAEHVDEAGDLGGSFAAGGEGSEKCGNLEFGRLLGEDEVEEGGSLGAGEGLFALDDALQGVVDRAGHTGSRLACAVRGTFIGRVCDYSTQRLRTLKLVR